MAGIELCKFTRKRGVKSKNIKPSTCVNLHNSMPAMNYFDSNRTNTVIFNHL